MATQSLRCSRCVGELQSEAWSSLDEIYCAILCCLVYSLFLPAETLWSGNSFVSSSGLPWSVCLNMAWLMHCPRIALIAISFLKSTFKFLFITKPGERWEFACSSCRGLQLSGKGARLVIRRSWFESRRDCTMFFVWSSWQFFYLCWRSQIKGKGKSLVKVVVITHDRFHVYIQNGYFWFCCVSVDLVFNRQLAMISHNAKVDWLEVRFAYTHLLINVFSQFLLAIFSIPGHDLSFFFSIQNERR